MSSIEQTRRTIVAGIAAASAAVPALTIAQEADPILAAARLARDAQARYRAASARQEAAEAEWEKVRDQFPDFVTVDVTFGPLPLGSAYRLRTEADITEFAVTTLAHYTVGTVARPIDPQLRKAVKAWRIAQSEALREAKERCEAERARRGLDDLEEEVGAAFNAMRDAQQAVLAMRPTTRAGAAAFAQIAGEYVDSSEDFDAARPAFERLAEFLVAGTA